MIRIRSLTLSNFKNVKHGTIKLSDVTCLEDLGSGADIVGIYGQNGSGKTSFIQALYILKLLMSGESLPSSVREYISSGEDRLSFGLEFLLIPAENRKVVDYVTGASLENPTTDRYFVEYRVNIGSCCGRSPIVLSESLRCKNAARGENYREVFAWSARDEESEREVPAASMLSFSSVVPSWVGNSDDAWDYELGEISPLSHWRSLGSIKPFASRLEVARQKAFEDGRSLLFSEGFLRAVIVALTEFEEDSPRSVYEAVTRVLIPAMQVSNEGRMYALRDMVVLPTAHQGVLALSYLPLASHEGDRGEYSDNFLLLDIEKIGLFPSQHVEELEHALSSINGVIDAIVPGLQIGVARLGRRAGEDGETLEEVELMAQRGKSSTPLRNESEGIKKILSIVSLLVDVHTNPLTFLAIDELDSGIFEYLLGEILSAIATHGMGQLVFTAHNLRPLEVLDSRNIWFTKNDASDRYVVSKGVRGSNNLRKMYLRSIRLGDDNDDVYSPTSPLEIDGALFDAGMAIQELQRAQAKMSGANRG